MRCASLVVAIGVVGYSRCRLDAMAAEAGRDPKSITISVYGQPPDGAAVRSYLNAGADRVVRRPGSGFPLSRE